MAARPAAISSTAEEILRRDISPETGSALPLSVLQFRQGRGLAGQRFAIPRAGTLRLGRSNKGVHVPDPMVMVLIQSWLAGSKVFIKYSYQQEKFANALKQSLSVLPAALKNSVRFCGDEKEFYRKAKTFDGFIVYGSDKTLNSVKDRLKAKARVLCHGHRVSGCVLFKKDLTAKRISQTVKHCARDIWLYDQRGCLSPQFVYVETKVNDFADPEEIPDLS